MRLSQRKTKVTNGKPNAYDNHDLFVVVMSEEAEEFLKTEIEEVELHALKEEPDYG